MSLLSSLLRRRNERPWQRRWVVFNGSELKYFRNKLDKDNLCLNIVELEKMIDVKRVPDVSVCVCVCVCMCVHTCVCVCGWVCC